MTFFYVLDVFYPGAHRWRISKNPSVSQWMVRRAAPLSSEPGTQACARTSQPSEPFPYYNILLAYVLPLMALDSFFPRRRLPVLTRFALRQAMSLAALT
jgi:hypothetical protein